MARVVAKYFELNGEDDIVVTGSNDSSGLYKVTAIVGSVRGLTCRTASCPTGFAGFFAGCCGGRNTLFTDICEESRHEAYALMLKHAREQGANGIICFRYDTSIFLDATEMVAYGTAVKIERV